MSSFNREFTKSGTGPIGSGSTEGFIDFGLLWKFSNSNYIDIEMFLYSNKGTSSSTHRINRPQGANKIGNFGKSDLLSNPKSIIDNRND